jgi:N-acetylglucosaminyl-diphospho-decaprenol L-rhamnosyltransferase
MNLATVGICLVNWNAGSFLTAAVSSACRVVASPAGQIVVVDNASTDDSVAILEKAFPEITIIRSPTNRGYGTGNNIGATELARRGFDFLLFMNPDVLLRQTTISRLLQALSRDHRAGCAGGVPIRGSSGREPVARNKPTVLEKLVMDSFLQRITPRRFVDRHIMILGAVPESTRVYSLAIGACIMFRTNAFLEAGGFDERVFLYSEEFTMAERLLRAGWHIVVSRWAEYDHIGALSTRQISFMRRVHFIRSEQYLLRDYYLWHPVLCQGFLSFRYLELFLYLARDLVWRLVRAAGR